MFDLIRKTMLTGIGLALRTKDEVEDLAKSFVKGGKMSEKEGRKFVQDVMNRYEETRKSLEERVEASVKAFLKKADVATKDE